MKLSSSLLLLSSPLLINALDVGLGDDSTFGMGGIDPSVVMKLLGATAACDIDVLSTGMALAGAGSDPDNMDLASISKILSDVVSPVDNECSVDDEKTFRDALSDFQTCSGVDLETMMETWPSASVGELLNCASTTIKNVQAYLPLLGQNGEISDLEKMPKPDFSEQCIKATYGPNPVGDFGRLLWMHPEIVCDCLGTFSKAAPDCTIEEWPIPLVGNWMRKSSCLINMAVCPLLEKMCEAELNVLDKCLPAMDLSSKQKYDCSAVEKSCLQPGFDDGFNGGIPSMPSLLNFPQEMTGAPMPDTCQTVAGYANFKSKNLVYRYNQHLNECVEKWEGWNEDYVSPKITTTTQLLASVSASGGGKKAKQAWGGFVGGMIVASVMFVGLVAYLYKTNNRVAQNLAGFRLMPSNGFELS